MIEMVLAVRYSLMKKCARWFCKSSAKALEEEEEDDANDGREVSHAAAAHMFKQCLSWLQKQPEATVCNTTMLRQL